MGFDVEIVVEEDCLAPELLCPICTGIIDSPVRTPCSHLFCQGCINSWFVRSKDCPQCRTAINAPNTTTVDRLLKNIIGATKVKCVKFKEGCNWIGKLDDLATHKCSLCSCMNCPYKLESENQARQIRELTEKCHTLETEIRSLRMRRASPPLVSPSPSLAPPPPSQSSSITFSPPLSTSLRMPSPVHPQAHRPSPPSQSPRASPRTQGSDRSNLNSNSNASFMSPFASFSPPFSSLSPQNPSRASSSSPRNPVNPTPPANAVRSLVCNNCHRSDGDRYTYYRCSDCTGQHHKNRHDYHLCAPCFLIYPPVHVGRFSKVE